MSANSSNAHFLGVRFIYSPYLAIKSALASLGPEMNLSFSESEHYCHILVLGIPPLYTKPLVAVL